MNIIRRSIQRPLNSVSLMYWLNLSKKKAEQRSKEYNENRSKNELIVYKMKQSEYLLIEGYEKYFSLYSKNPKMKVRFVIGDYESDLEARYAAVRELLSYHQSAWITKMQQFKILYKNYKQCKNTLSSKLGIPYRKVEHYLLDEDIPIKIRARAAECELGRLANAICRSTLNERMKNIMYEFITYPAKHNLRLTDQSWKMARSMILNTTDDLMELSDRNIRFLIVRHAIEYKKRSKENFHSDLENIKNRLQIKLFTNTYVLKGKQKSAKEEAGK